MADHSAALPTDIDVLHALVTSVLAERDAAIAERDELAARNAKLEHLIREIRRAHFGRKSERIDDDQLALALEELETATAKEEAKDEKASPELKQKRARARRASRALNFDHLPHEEVVIERCADTRLLLEPSEAEVLRHPPRRQCADRHRGARAHR